MPLDKCLRVLQQRLDSCSLLTFSKIIDYYYSGQFLREYEMKAQFVEKLTEMLQSI